MTFKRFIVFGSDNYYPSGGLSDIIAEFDTLEEIKKAVEKDGKHGCYSIKTDSGIRTKDKCEVLDLEKREEIYIDEIITKNINTLNL